MYGILIQWAQYNKFVENGLKNYVLMNWTTASIESYDIQTRTKDTDTNKLLVGGG